MDTLNSILAQQAKILRKNSTEAEAVLWEHLRSRRFCGLKFRRQETIGRFIADFVCFEIMLIIELDGKPHEAQTERDAERDALLDERGFRVLRFWNDAVVQDMENVLKEIEAAIPPRPAMGEGAGGEGSPLLPPRPVMGEGLGVRVQGVRVQGVRVQGVRVE